MEIKDLKTIFNKETKVFIRKWIKERKAELERHEKYVEKLKEQIETEIEILEAFVD